MTWSLEGMPDQTGRRIVVTGPTLGGLGHHTALELARRGAEVVLAGRTEAKLAATADAIREQVPGASLAPLVVDLSDQASIRRAAAEAEGLGALDALVNNAGVMATAYRRTADDLELQMATNHFGPFLLTGLLLPQLVASGDGRVVAIASQMHRQATRAPLGDPHTQEGRYLRWQVYSRTKLANLLFTFELERRLRAAELPVRALAAHPGFSGTHLVVNGQLGRSSGPVASILDAATRAVSQSAAHGAWPTLMAVTADLPGGSYCGPDGLYQMRGRPILVGTSSRAREVPDQRRLWEISEQATGIAYP